MSLIEGAGEHWNSPIEVVERMATDNELPFERAVQDEIALVVSGKLPTIRSRSPGWTRSRCCTSPARSR